MPGKKKFYYFYFGPGRLGFLKLNCDPGRADSDSGEQNFVTFISGRARENWPVLISSSTRAVQRKRDGKNVDGGRSASKRDTLKILCAVNGTSE